MKRILSRLVIVIASAGIASAQGGKRPLSLDDLGKIKEVRDPHCAPDGKTVAFVVSVSNSSSGRHGELDVDQRSVGATCSQRRRLGRACGPSDVLRQHSVGAIWLDASSENVALFLPFGCNKDQQLAAKSGTRRRSKIAGFYV